ncbi:hypothetical protein ACHAW5_000426 [Stephanodiscus triporus]|uniref:Uncharacterized protein n=1 Tax=Stephanodiscus triporus TaxID=2934178 RepID=A0ABD3Q4J4_9STRA
MACERSSDGRPLFGLPPYLHPPLLGATWFASDERATSSAVALNQPGGDGGGARRRGRMVDNGGGRVGGDGDAGISSSRRDDDDDDGRYRVDDTAMVYVAAIGPRGGTATATTTTTTTTASRGTSRCRGLSAFLCAGTCRYFRDSPPVPPSASEAGRRLDPPPRDDAVPRLGEGFFRKRGFGRAVGWFVFSIAITNVVGAFIEEGGVTDRRAIAWAGCGFEMARCIMLSLIFVLPLGLTQHRPDRAAPRRVAVPPGFLRGPDQRINAALAVDVTFPRNDSPETSRSAMLVPWRRSAAKLDYQLLPSVPLLASDIWGDVIFMMALAIATLCYYRSPPEATRDGQERNLELVASSSRKRGGGEERDMMTTMIDWAVAACRALHEELKMTGREKRGRMFVEPMGVKETSATSTRGGGGDDACTSDDDDYDGRDGDAWKLESNSNVRRAFVRAEEFFLGVVVSRLPMPATMAGDGVASSTLTTTTMRRPTLVVLRRVWRPFRALGHVYVATEGINAQMAVPMNLGGGRRMVSRHAKTTTTNDDNVPSRIETLNSLATQRDVPFTVGLFCIADDDAHCHQLMPPGTIDKVDGRKTFDADCWKDVVETTIALAGWAKREMRRERNRRRRRSKGVETKKAYVRNNNNYHPAKRASSSMMMAKAEGRFDDDDDDVSTTTTADCGIVLLARRRVPPTRRPRHHRRRVLIVVVGRRGRDESRRMRKKRFRAVGGVDGVVSQSLLAASAKAAKARAIVDRGRRHFSTDSHWRSRYRSARSTAHRDNIEGSDTLTAEGGGGWRRGKRKRMRKRKRKTGRAEGDWERRGLDERHRQIPRRQADATIGQYPCLLTYNVVDYGRPERS